MRDHGCTTRKAPQHQYSVQPNQLRLVSRGIEASSHQLGSSIGQGSFQCLRRVASRDGHDSFRYVLVLSQQKDDEAARAGGGKREKRVVQGVCVDCGLCAAKARFWLSARISRISSSHLTTL